MVDIRLVAPYSVVGIKSASFREAINYIKRQSVIGFDIETTGLDVHTNDIVTVQLGTDKIVYVFDVRFIDITKFKTILESTKIVKCGANLKFDVKHMIKYKIFSRNLHDVMLWEQIMNNGAKVEKGFYGLAAISKRWNVFDYDSNDFGISKNVRTSFQLKYPLTKEQIVYAGFDVYTVCRIYQKQTNYTKNDPIVNCIKLENDYVLPISWCEYNGIYLNVDKWLENLEVYKEKLSIQQAKLDEFAASIGVDNIN
jgi:DNA polymerase I-like protein with 3'-5' exonuclease and polymerase domains